MERTAVDYSRMSYEELRRMADDDSVAGDIPEEEYEALSIELWRKFSAGQGPAELETLFEHLSRS